MSLAQITYKILNDARKEANAVAKKAKNEAEAIKKASDAKCQEITADFADRFEVEKPEILRRREIVAGIDIAKMMLDSKRKLIEDVFSGALQKLSDMPKEEYLDFAEKLFRIAVKTKKEVVVVGENEEYITPTWINIFNVKNGTKLVLSDAKANINGGFLLVNGRTSVDCSWNMLIKAFQEKQEADVVKRLFPAE